ncbi:MAG TPA: hypothetical protein VLG13_01400 [Patescibacteria group bacterium]|nr:hypothetical protein [Patescibacteria group bacterium]
MPTQFGHDKQAAEIYKGLAGPRQHLVREAAGALALQYDVEPETISLFGKAGHRSVQLVVAYAGISGLDLGRRRSKDDQRRSWKGIYPEQLWDSERRREPRVPKIFALAVEGQPEPYDTRLGMCRWVYASMVARARRQHKPLPDSPPADLTDVHAWTWTLLTGESRLRDCAPIVCTWPDKTVYSSPTALTNGMPNILWRPGLILAGEAVE